jgi:hypothetical protein
LRTPLTTGLGIELRNCSSPIRSWDQQTAVKSSFRKHFLILAAKSSTAEPGREQGDARVTNAHVRKAKGIDLGSLERNEPMVSCQTIIAHLSEYLDGDAAPEMGQKIEKHLRRCQRCTAVYDSTRKMLVITGDERAFDIPAGFSERLDALLDKAISDSKSL